MYLLNCSILALTLGFPGGSEVKASASNAGDPGPIPGSGRSPGKGNGNPLQYSCLENPMDRGAWWAAVHGAQSQTRLKRLSMLACIVEGNGNPLQYFCLENPRDRGAWWATVCGVSQSRTWLKWLSSRSRGGINFPLPFYVLLAALRVRFT